MPKLYCPTCGGATEYSTTSPKFCSSCGGGFAVTFTIASAPQPAKPPLSRPQVIIEGRDEDKSEPRTISIPEKLDVSIVLEDRDRLQRQKLSELGEPTGMDFSRGSEKSSKRARKQKLAEFRTKLQTVHRNEAE